jgi:hypothetical protein
MITINNRDLFSSDEQNPAQEHVLSCQWSMDLMSAPNLLYHQSKGEILGGATGTGTNGKRLVQSCRYQEV